MNKKAIDNVWLMIIFGAIILVVMIAIIANGGLSALADKIFP